MVHRTVLQYQLLEKLGAGGMGEVYKARDTRLNRFVAMKVLSAGMAADPDRRKRFVQEAQAVSALNHPNIITIYDVIDDAGTQFMVVEYVDGKTLVELIPKGGMPVPLVVKYAAQMTDALASAHAAGIVHRDLKPANVMVTGNGWVKVLDFGLAKLVDWAQAAPDAATITLMPAPLTVEGTLLGTVNYMSPEQAEGKRVDARSDIFSFGAVLYEMLTGEAAFRGDSVVSTLSAVLRDEVRPVRELAPEVPPELERILGACLKKDPDARIQTMAEIQAVLGGLRQQMDSGIREVPVIVRARPRSAMPKVAAAMVILGLAAGGFWWWMHRPNPAPQPARSQPASAQQIPATVPVPEVHTGPLTNADILAMAAARVPSAEMIGQIESSKHDFDLSAGEVVRLTKAGVPSEVIAAMRGGDATPAATPAVPADITLNDGLAVHLVLAEDIPIDAAEGDAVQFKVARDVRVDDVVVIHKGAAASGAIVDSPKKKLLVLGGKMTFRLDKVEAADGQKVSIRVTPAKKDGPLKRQVDAGAKKSKDVASPEGTAYMGYVDGARTVSVRK